LVTYVADGIAGAMAQAKAAAGDRNVMVHGAYTAQRALEAGVLEELEIHQIPVLFGGGRRLFEVLASRVELEIVRVIDTPEATHIHSRVRRRFRGRRWARSPASAQGGQRLASRSANEEKCATRCPALGTCRVLRTAARRQLRFVQAGLSSTTAPSRDEH
jgi:hypothetical protein